MARAAIAAASLVRVSPVSFFEIAQKVRIGKWPEMAAFVAKLPTLLDRQGGAVAILEPAICINAGGLSWAHRDPFDRLLAATAQFYNLPIVSADAVFDGFVQRMW
jgi:PIN domain nuclease of toxin-antitoxin system